MYFFFLTAFSLVLVLFFVFTDLMKALNVFLSAKHVMKEKKTSKETVQ